MEAKPAAYYQLAINRRVKLRIALCWGGPRLIGFQRHGFRTDRSSSVI